MAKKTPKNEIATTKPFQLQNQDASFEAKLAVLTAQIDKEYGKGSITTISGPAKPQKPQYQIPSGSLALDMALGTYWRRPDRSWVTGYGGGRIGEIFGPEGSGKTTLLGLAIANVQKMNGVAAMIDAEHNLDVNYFMKLGVDMSKLLFSQPNSGEEALQIAETLIRSGIVNFIGIDSVPALVPKAQMEGDIGDSYMGKHAQLMSQSLAKFTNLLGQGQNCNVVLTNQIREKVGVVFGNPETTPGGRALKFYASTRIEVKRGEAITQGSDKNIEQIGHVLRIHVLKNKLAPPFRKCEAPLYYGIGIDNVTELVDLCIDKGVIEQNGAWLKHNGKLLGQGKVAVIMKLREDRHMCYALYDELFTRVLAAQGFTPELEPIPGFQAPAQAPNHRLLWTPGSAADEAEKAFIESEVVEQETPPEQVEQVVAKPVGAGAPL